MKKITILALSLLIIVSASVAGTPPYYGPKKTEIKNFEVSRITSVDQMAPVILPAAIPVDVVGDLPAPHLAKEEVFIITPSTKSITGTDSGILRRQDDNNLYNCNKRMPNEPGHQELFQPFDHGL